MRLFGFNVIQNRDLKRSLSEDETRQLHNAWMNDVGAWMTPDCLQKYNYLLEEAEKLGKEKGKDKYKDKKGTSKGSAGKPAKGI